MRNLNSYSDNFNHQKKYIGLALLSITLLIVIVYINSIYNDFVMDDVSLIRNNLSIRKLSNAWNLLMTTYRPLRFISLAVDYHFWGLNPVGYHLSNILLHIFCSLLVYGIVRKMVKDHRVSLYTAILYAVHPIHTDAVSYLSGRRDVLFAFFFFLAFYCFLYYRENSRKKYLLALFVFFFLSLLSKEMAASFPVLLFGYDLLLQFRSEHPMTGWAYSIDFLRSAGQIIKKYYLFYSFLFLLIPISIYYYVNLRTATLLVEQSQIEWWGGTVLTNFLNSAYLLIHYIKKLFFPVVLVADNSAFPVIQSFKEIKAVVALFVLILLFVTVFKLINKNKIYAFSLLFFLITLLPVMHIVPHHELLAEHYLYLPSFGFCLFMGLGFKWLGERTENLSRFVFLIFALASLLFSLRTLERNKDWANEFTIYHKDLQAYPDNRRVRLVLGKVYMDSFLYEDAMQEFDRANQGNKVFKEAYAYKSYIHYKRGDLSVAISEAKKSLKIEDWDFAHFNLGKYYQTIEDDKNALFHFQKITSGKQYLPATVYAFQIYQNQWDRIKADEAAKTIISLSEGLLRFKPRDREPLRNLARCYEWRMRFDEADVTYQRLQKAVPDLSSLILSRIDQIQKEKRDFLRAAQLLANNNEDAEGLFLMGKVQYRIGRYADALESLNKAVQADPERADPYFFLARVLKQKQDLKNAIENIKEGIALQGREPDYHYFLGLIYANDLQFELSIRAFEQAAFLGMEGREFESDYNKALLNRKRYQSAQQGESNRIDLARVYFDYQLLHKAASTLKELEKTADSNQELLHQIGLLYTQMGHRYTGDAIRVYRRILQFSPEDAEAYTRLGYIYWKEVEELPLVILNFSKSLALNPSQKQAVEMQRVVEELTRMYQTQ